MKQLRKAAARERRIPILWWFLLMLVMGCALFVLVHQRSQHLAWLLVVLLAAAWVAPLAAMMTMVAPRRSLDPIPVPGEGTFAEWLIQARRIGRTLIYYGENRAISPELRRTIEAGIRDLRETLHAHPLRDDLERGCRRLWDGPIQEVKDWLWRNHGDSIRQVERKYQDDLAQAEDSDDRLAALQEALENAAATMTRHCMSRMLERERLVCARDCAWLAGQAANSHGQDVLFPVRLSAALVVEWSDFSEPWQPARMLHRATARLAAESAAAAPAPAEGPEPGLEVPVAGPKQYRRVRVKVRRKYRHARPYRGPSILEILLSFGQWVRYSVRAWMLYR